MLPEQVAQCVHQRPRRGRESNTAERQAQLANVLRVQAASMERRPEPAYDFCEPLLEDAVKMLILVYSLDTCLCSISALTLFYLLNYNLMAMIVSLKEKAGTLT